MTQGPIRLLLLDPHALVRASLARYLAAQPDMEVAESGTPEDALRILRDSAIDLVLLDFDGDEAACEGFLETACSQGYPGQFLVVTAAAGPGRTANAIRLGVSGVFLKSETPARLVQAIHLMSEGGVWLERKFLRDLAGQLPAWQKGPPPCKRSHSLSDREYKVLMGVLGGLTNRRIGDRLGVSEASVKAALQHLFSRTGVRSRTQLVRMALEGALGHLGKAEIVQSNG